MKANCIWSCCLQSCVCGVGATGGEASGGGQELEPIAATRLKGLEKVQVLQEGAGHIEAAAAGQLAHGLR